MAYLERNKLILDEIRHLPLQRGQVVVDAIRMTGLEVVTRTTVTSLGTYQSSVLQRDVHIALKEKLSYSGGLFYRNMELTDELSIIDVLSHSSFQAELPLFYGHLRTSDGEHIGNITEDFTRQGKCEVRDIPYTSEMLPRGIRDLFGLQDYDMPDHDCLDHVAFLVNGERRLGDFDNLLDHVRKRRDKVKALPAYQRIQQHLSDYTLQINPGK